MSGLPFTMGNGRRKNKNTKKKISGYIPAKIDTSMDRMTGHILAIDRHKVMVIVGSSDDGPVALF